MWFESPQKRNASSILSERYKTKPQQPHNTRFCEDRLRIIKFVLGVLNITVWGCIAVSNTFPKYDIHEY